MVANYRVIRKPIFGHHRVMIRRLPDDHIASIRKLSRLLSTAGAFQGEAIHSRSRGPTLTSVCRCGLIAAGGAPPGVESFASKLRCRRANCRGRDCANSHPGFEESLARRGFHGALGARIVSRTFAERVSWRDEHVRLLRTDVGMDLVCRIERVYAAASLGSF